MNLLEALQQQYPASSRRTLQNWIKRGQVSVDGVITTKATLGISKQAIRVEKKQQRCSSIPILYEDRYLIIIDKPAGLLSVPAEKAQPSALSLLRDYYSVYAVHRLDQETSGTLLFARGRLSEQKFDEMFEAHAVEREYLAIVEGRMSQNAGTWESYLREKENYDVEVSPEGKRAITHYEVIHRSKNYTYLRLKLETGRKHQIRVQCREVGFPIVGDKRYGSSIKNRVCLHAYRLCFTHPFTGKDISVTASIPAPLIKLGLKGLVA